MLNRFSTVDEFLQAMHEQCGVRLADGYPSGAMRLATHYYIDDAAVSRTVGAFRQLLAPK